MDKGVHEIRLQQWISIIKDCNDSGLTKSQWCRDNGVSRRQFNYWQHKIRNLALESQKQTSLAGTTEVPGFCEIVPATEPLPLEGIQRNVHQPTRTDEPDHDHHDRDAGITVELGECRILVSEGFSEDSLSSVLRVLRDA